MLWGQSAEQWPPPAPAVLWLAKHLQIKAPTSLGVQAAPPGAAESLAFLIFHLRCFQSISAFLSSAIHHKNGAAELKDFVNESLGRCIPLPSAHKSELLFLSVRKENVAKHSGNKLRDEKEKERKSRQ